MARPSGSTCPATGRSGRYASESGRVVLTLSFVVHDPELTLSGEASRRARPLGVIVVDDKGMPVPIAAAFGDSASHMRMIRIECFVHVLHLVGIIGGPQARCGKSGKRCNAAQ